MNRTGSLLLCMGPMFSGKTTNLARELSRYADIGLKVLCIGHNRDVRNESTLSTHSLGGVSLSPRIITVKTDALSTVNFNEFDVIGVDEGQFFGLGEARFENDLYKTVSLWLKENKIVVISGLDGDSFRRPFGHLLDLIPLSDEVRMFTAHCLKCIESGQVTPARFTYRMTAEVGLVVIGGQDKFMPLCRRHYEQA